MCPTGLKEKKVKDLTVEEFKHLIQEIIAEDIEAWKETFEIMADRKLMRQIANAKKARIEGKKADFIPWEKVRRNL
ncbi:MAG TPA: hypothetical protein ENH01_08675 [Nitrospirae bacterium]|nr:hypothetical protein [Nitrospirota bacterium]